MTPLGTSHNDAFMCTRMCVDKYEWICVLLLECHDMSVSAFRLNKEGLQNGESGVARANEIKRKNRKTMQQTNKRMEKSCFPTSETPPRFWRHFLARSAKIYETQQNKMNNE